MSLMAARRSATVGGVIIPPIQPITRLDVAEAFETQAVVTVDVLSNDPQGGDVVGPAITLGPAGGSVDVFNNQIRLTHNGVGVYVVSYNVDDGGLQDQGFVTISIKSTGVSGSPPGVAANTYQFGETANQPGNVLTISTPMPADVKGVVLFLGTFAEFPTEPVTINGFDVKYNGNPMARVDEFDDLMYIGNDGSASGVAPVPYAFYLPNDGSVSFPLTGTFEWDADIGGPKLELQCVGIVPITHADRVPVVSVIGDFRGVGNSQTDVVSASAASNSVAVNASMHKRRVTPASDANWTELERVIVDNAQNIDIQSGRLLVESRVFASAGNADYVVSSEQANLHGSVTLQFADPAGGIVGPSQADRTATVITGGFQTAIDMSAAGAPITAINVISGGGVASFFAQNLLFTPPALDGTTIVEVAQANAGGAVISTVTITSLSQGIGPLTGFAAGVGQTETSLLAITANIQAAQDQFEAELLGLFDTRANSTNDAAIIAANPTFVVLTDKTLTGLTNALGAGNRRLLLTAAGGDYNWGGGGLPDFDDIELIGLVDDGMPEVIIGGTPKNRGQIRFPIRGQGGSVEGICWKDGALCFSFVGAVGTLPKFHQKYCRFKNVGNAMHHEFDPPTGSTFWGKVNLGAGCADIQVFRCLAEDVSHGWNCRFGPGYGENNPVTPGQSPDFEVGGLSVVETIVKGADNMGLCFHYDTRGGTVSSVFWPGIGANVEALVNRCIVTNRTMGSSPGFPLNLSACPKARVLDSWFTNTLANPFGVDDDFYSKNDEFYASGCIVWNTGASGNFQGQVGCKGEGNAGSIPLTSYQFRNGIIGHDDTKGVSRGIFAQRSGITFDGTLLICATGSIGQGGGITQQGGGDGYNFFRFQNGMIRAFGGFNQSVVAQIAANVSDWGIVANIIETLRPGNHTLIEIKNSSGFDNLDALVNSNDFRKIAGAGTVLAVSIEPNGTLRNPTIDDNDFDDIDDAASISGGNITGALTITNNRHTGQTPGFNNFTGSTVNSSNNTFPT